MPQDRPVADVMTVAKRDLRAGETLDEFGGYTFHGTMDRMETALELRALPVGLAPGARLSARWRRRRSSLGTTCSSTRAARW